MASSGDSKTETAREGAGKAPAEQGDKTPKAADTQTVKAEASTKALSEITAQDQKEFREQKESKTSDKPAASAAEKALPSVSLVDSQKAPDRKALEKDAEAIRKATGNDNYIARWSDNERIINILKGKSEAEIKVLDEVYRKKYNISLERETAYMSGSDREKVMGALYKKDNDKAGLEVSRVATALAEGREWTGRSQTMLDKDLRDSLRGATSGQIQEMEREYQRRHGISLSAAIERDGNIGKETKEALKIYLKGSDKRDAQDIDKLATLALKSSDLQFFKEVMKDASPADRARFMQNGGDKRLSDAFSGNDLAQAKDFVKEGKLSAATQVKENTGTFIDNNQGIELALSRMTDEERARYRIGRHLAGKDKELSEADQKSLSAMPEAEKTAASAYYKELRKSLEGAGNSTELARWESLINTRNGSFVASLDQHRGLFWNASTATIGSAVENMSEKDWKDAKANPNARKELDTMLVSLNKSEQERAAILKIFDDKMKAQNFAETKDTGRVSVKDKLEENWGVFKNDQGAMLEAIGKMTAEERTRYREDANFRKELDRKVERYLSGDTEKEAQRLLSNILTDGKTGSDILTKLTQHKANLFTDEEAALRDIDQALRQDPKLRERLQNPQSQADLQFKADFERIARQTLGKDRYEALVPELIAKGGFDLEKMTRLSKGFFSDDEETTYKDIAAASKESRDRLINDKAYRDQALSHLNEDEKKIALAVAAQGEFKPEDKIRQMVLGFGGSKEIVGTLKDLAPEQLKEVKAAYALKYGKSFENDLMDKLGGQELAEARRILSSDKDLNTRIDAARDDIYATRSGVGAGFADVFSATGKQADDTMDELLKTASDAARTGRTLSPEETKALFENYGKAVDNHRESKSAAADYTADAIIAGGTIASVIATGGTNLPLVAAVLAAGGAATKVGTKSLLMGNDYDFALGTVAKDASIGALTGATSVFGQAQLAAVFKIGQQSAAAASGKVVETLTRKSLSEIAKSAGLSVADDATYLAPGFEKLISEGTGATMRNLLANGATKIEERAFQEIAEKAVDASIQGALREAAVQAVRKELAEKATEEFAKHTANWLTYQATAQALNAGAGGGANSLTGALEGLTKWDSNKSLAYNIKHVGMETFASTIAGAGGALAFGGLFKAAEVGHARWSSEPSLKAGESPELRPEIRPDSKPDLSTPAVLDFSPGNGHFAAIDNSAAPEGKLWHPQRDFTKLEPAERSALLGRLGNDRSPLAGKASIETYISDFDAVARGWDEKMGKLPALKESGRAHLEQATREARELSESLGVPVKDGHIDIDAMRAKANGDAQVEQTIKNYEEKRGVYAALVNAENSQAAQRAQSLQPVFDKFAQEQGLPPIKIKTGDALSMSGQAAYYRNGELYIHPHYLLDGSRKLDLLELGYHELTHHEHSFTVARSYADALKLNGAPDRNQAEVLSHVFKQQTGQDLSPEAALTFLEKRHSLAKPNLDEQGLARARRLEAALAQNHPIGAKLDDLATSFRVAESALKRLDDKEQTVELLTRLYAPNGEGKALSLRLFGSEMPPASLTKILGGDAADKVEAAAAELRATITKRMDGINQERRLAYDSYMQDHEVDAFLTGQKARVRATELGIKDGPSYSRSSTSAGSLDVSLDRVDAPNLARATKDIIESIQKTEETAVKPPRIRLGLDNNKGTPTDFNPKNGTFIFRDVTINQKLPLSATTSKAQRNLKVGDELNLKLHPEGALDRTPLKVIAITNEEITLSYQGRFEMRAGDAKRHNQGLADDLKAFAVSRMSARIDDPRFQLDSNSPYLIDLLRHGDHLQRADIKLLNQALRAQQFDGQFRYNLLSEVKRRGALGEIDENTGHAWLYQIAERSGASKLDKGKEYLDFFRAMPDEKIARMAKDKIKVEPLQKALNEVVVGSRLDALSSKERAAVLVKALKATPSIEDGGLTNNTAITSKIFKNFEPESLDSLSQADRALVVDRARRLARTLERSREGIENAGGKSRSEHVAELFGMLNRAEVVSEGTLNRALDKLSPNEVRALREVLEEDKDFLTMSGFNRKIDELVETLRAHDRNGTDRSFIRVAKPNETEALFRNAEIVSVYVNDDDAGRALAYAFRKRSGISVDIHSPSTIETPRANMVLLTRAENVAGSKAEDLINRGQAHLAEAFADFDQKFNFMDIAKAEIAPDIFEAKLKKLAQERMSKSEASAAASQSGDDRAAIKRLLADGSAEEESLQERALLAILRMEQDRANATAEAFLEASHVVSLRDLYKGAKGLAEKLHAGRNPEDFIYVVDGDGEGSGLFITEIFRQMNPRSQYMTRGYLDLHESAELRGKTFVILDDCVYSGSSAIKHAGLLEDLTKRFDGTRAVVGTIDAHTEGLVEFAANRHSLATKGEQKLAQLVVANDTRPDFKQAVRASLVRMKSEELATPEALEALTAKSEKAQWSKSPLVSGMIYPHMLPNNNPDEFNRLMGSVLDRAGAHSESPVRLQRQALEYGPQNAGRVDDLVTRGGAGTKEQLEEIIAANKVGMIIDLRDPKDSHASLQDRPRKKTLSPREEEEFIKELSKPDAKVEYKNIGLSTSADKQLTAKQVEQFLDLMDRANKEGIPVYVHCEFGRDRTGLMIGLYRMWHHRRSAEKAWEEALAYGFNRNLAHMAKKLFDLELEL